MSASTAKTVAGWRGSSEVEINGNSSKGAVYDPTRQDHFKLAARRQTRCLPPGEGPPRVRTPPGEQVNKCYNKKHTLPTQTYIHINL